MRRIRHKARIMAVQALYSWQISGTKNSLIVVDFLNMIQSKKIDVDIEYFKKIFIGTSNKVSKIDRKLFRHTSRALKLIDQIEKAILRLGVFEILYIKIPYKVIINEAIELSKKFGSERSYKFVNGVLDKIVFKKKESSSS
ncbi:transcription antitermination factor NusB [Candidatus Riesia pediculicola]|uniref:transcription antitermination factor NusB n=1 Tax=Candidatus Riesia pediculicola TaxID=401619 RepID=UPI0009C22F63|nr:transcription antitermination factor NusB [Candidatus Riesia pediculicola]ARC54154.1 hypothetical protein AOE57_00790 [Candidatus Riesia pediculicola]